MERSGKMTIEEVLAVEEMQVFDRKSVNIAPKVLAQLLHLQMLMVAQLPLEYLTRHAG